MITPKWPICGAEENRRLQETLERGDWSRGIAIQDFEESFAKYCGTKHALLTNSGTDSLRIALLASGIEPGDEVILPGLTWPTTAVSVMECGAKAVIVDVEPETYGISLPSVRRAISRKTKAIVAVHLYCSTADLDGLLEIAEETGIALIEDAAQAHGCSWRGQQVGGFGKAGAFSFNQKKLMTCGEGGCIVTNDDLIYQQAFALRDIDGRIAGQTVIRCGGNNQMSSICAAILSAQLERLPTIAAQEARGAEYLCRRLAQIPGIAGPKIRPAVSQQSFYSFGLRLIDEQLIANRSQLLAALFNSLSIKLSRSYAPLDVSDLFHPELEPRYRGLWQFHPLPGCHQAYSETIRLPHYWLLSAEEVLEQIATAIAAAVDQCHGARRMLSTAGTSG